MKRRAALRLVGLTASAGVLAACGVAAPAQPTTAPLPAPTAAPAAPTAAQSSAPTAAPTVSAGQPTAVTQSQAKSGGTLNAAIQTDLPNVDPHYSAPSAYDALWPAFDRLIAMDHNLQPQPMLAETWEVTPDYRQITFHLRHGVQFSTGRELTSDDVKYNFMRVRDPKVGGGGWVAFSNWWTIDTPDRYTVVLNSDVPRPLVFDNLETFNIIDQVTAEGPNAKSQAVGTGPFILKEWAQGDHVTLIKNPNYWQSGLPYLDGIEYRILPDAQTMVAQFEAGALDMVLNPPLLDVGRLEGDPKYQAVTNPYTGRYYTAGWNVANPPLDNKQVRQALNYAMNRQRFVDTVLLGLGRPITLPWIPTSPAYEADKANYFAFDLDKAKSLLEQAGVGPFGMEYLISPNYPELSNLGQIYQADLATIGVSLTIKQAESAAFFDAINNRTYSGMYAITSARANLAPGITILSTQGFNPDQNNEGFSSDAYSQLAAAIATETDPQKQKQLYAQLNDLLLDAAFTVAIASSPPRMLLKS
ncbi:MAG: ABC transporter substrate-binding protein, partial [Chloroflexi bacterium]|nr:ABC transporter substrate-binding protein [Chloroflexota bacterium]